MKVITDYFSRPGGVNKSTTPAITPTRMKKNKKRKVKKTADVDMPSISLKETVSDNEDGPVYEIRRIKIRLADPNVPDSYVCEVYDSSPVLDDDASLSQSIESEPGTRIDLSTRETVFNNDDEIENNQRHGRSVRRRASGLKMLNGVMQVMEEKPVESNRKAKRRRSSSCVKMKADSESSSDEALVSVKKRLKVDNVESAGTKRKGRRSLASNLVNEMPDINHEIQTNINHAIPLTPPRKTRSSSSAREVILTQNEAKNKSKSNDQQVTSSDVTLTTTSSQQERVEKSTKEEKHSATAPNRTTRATFVSHEKMNNEEVIRKSPRNRSSDLTPTIPNSQQQDKVGKSTKEEKRSVTTPSRSTRTMTSVCQEKSNNEEIRKSPRNRLSDFTPTITSSQQQEKVETSTKEEKHSVTTPNRRTRTTSLSREKPSNEDITRKSPRNQSRDLTPTSTNCHEDKPTKETKDSAPPTRTTRTASANRKKNIHEDNTRKSPRNRQPPKSLSEFDLQSETRNSATRESPAADRARKSGSKITQYLTRNEVDEKTILSKHTETVPLKNSQQVRNLQHKMKSALQRGEATANAEKDGKEKVKAPTKRNKGGNSKRSRVVPSPQIHPSSVKSAPTKECNIILAKTQTKQCPANQTVPGTIKDCSIFLEKTPIKLCTSPSEPSPTKDCSVILQKLSSETLAKKIESAKIRDIPLAPLFIKKATKKATVAPIFMKKQKVVVDVDPEVLKARQAFLQSGIPQSMRKKLNNTKPQEVESVVIFPATSHVQQRGDEEQWSKRLIPLELKGWPEELRTGDYPAWQSLTFTLEKPRVKKPIKILEKLDENVVGKILAAADKNVQILDIFNLVKERRESYLEDEQELQPVWSEKYKPDTEQILNNDKTALRLKKWLQSWKLYDEELRDGVRRRKEDMDSSDDFISSDEESKQPRAPKTACLLHGPISSGKTTLVSALASQLDFTVLEVNSSSKRSGKKMLSDLQEATQSHKIVQEATGSVGRADRMSVIVVEEADVVFDDHDEGFVSGLQSLIASAKRPVILLTNQLSAPHLDKFRNAQTMQLAMVRPNISAACAVLELVCLVEGIVPSRTSLLRLLGGNQQDLRKSLLELQFWVQNGVGSGNVWPIVSMAPPSSSRLWWASHKAILGKDLWHVPSMPASLPLSDFSENSSEPPDNLHKEGTTNPDLLHNFLCYAESMSLSDTMAMPSNSHCELNRRDFLLKDSSTLTETLRSENIQHVRFRHELEQEISDLTARLFLGRTASDDIPVQIPYKEARWLSTQVRAKEELLEVVPNQPGAAALHCDYLPALRSMCRQEKLRVAANNKRRNRFYHYLRTLGASPTQSNLATTCQVLAESRSNIPP